MALILPRAPHLCEQVGDAGPGGPARSWFGQGPASSGRLRQAIAAAGCCESSSSRDRAPSQTSRMARSRNRRRGDRRTVAQCSRIRCGGTNRCWTAMASRVADCLSEKAYWAACTTATSTGALGSPTPSRHRVLRRTWTRTPGSDRTREFRGSETWIVSCVQPLSPADPEQPGPRLAVFGVRGVHPALTNRARRRRSGPTTVHLPTAEHPTTSRPSEPMQRSIRRGAPLA